ncbi:hypothetical protein ACFX11_007289 [Malus domestica]
MKLKPKELPKGSQLIMGLNPPFGVKAALANKFIDKALEFDPKLLILIVPPETQRLNEKKSPYDLIWEDTQFLSGKSFYLPGSVDANDKQLDQWNVMPPPVYLWSHPDWSADIKAIAQEHGHITASQGYTNDNSDSLNNGRSIGNNDQYGEAPMLIDDGIKPESPGDGNNIIDEICKEMLPLIQPAEKGDQHSEPGNSGSSMQFGTTYGGTKFNIADDTGRRSYSMSSDEPYSNLTHRWSTGPNSGYRATNSEEPFVGHTRERLDSLGCRPYLDEAEDAFRRESDVRHSHPGLAAELSYRMNTSVMQRYAPRLDELNHMRMGRLGSEPALGYQPHMFSSDSTYDPRAPLSVMSQY